MKKFWDWFMRLFKKKEMAVRTGYSQDRFTSVFPKWKASRDKWIRVNRQFPIRVHVWHENRKGKQKYMYSGGVVSGTTLIRNPNRRSA